jgi:HK97 family phage portal protein
MRWIDRIQHALKAFRLGPAVVEPADTYWGKDPEPFAPPAYGDYIATSSSVYACSTLRARNMASLPLRAYRMVQGERVEVTDGPFKDLMSAVNPHWTYNRLMQMTELSLCLWGQAFWVLERGPNGQGAPREIWWARPDRMRLVPDEKNYIAGWIYDWDNERLPFTPDEVIWFRFPNPLDEFMGLSPIAATRLAIDTAQGALQSNHSIFKNGLQIAGVVSPQDKETAWSREQTEQLRESLERRFKGADKAHRLAVLGQAASFQTMGVSPKDAQFIELMKWTRSDVASVYGVPPELIGDHEHATYSNIEQAYKGLWTDCLIPEASMIASEITEQMLKFFPDVDVVEFDTTHVSALQPDKASLADQAGKWVAMGVPLNRVLSQIAPQMLPEGGEYPWGNAPMMPMLPPAPIQDNVQGATRAIKKMSGPMGRRGFIEFGSPEHVAIWKAFDLRARRIETQFVRILSELMQEQGEAIAAAVAEQGAKAAGYDGIDFKPSGRVRSAFRKGIELYEAGRGGDGLVAATIRWARRLAAGEAITPDKARKMRAWHARHASDKVPGWDKEGDETPGYVAFLLWGGEPGRDWSERLVSQMDKADEQGRKALTPDDIDALWDGDYWQSVFADRLMGQIQAAAEAGGADAFSQLNVDARFDLDTPDGNRFLMGRTQRFAEQVNETTWNQLREGIADAINSGKTIPEIEELVQQVMGDRIRSSAETIARTETIGALNGGSLLGAKQSGVDSKKTWIAALDQRTRESHVDAHVQYQESPIPLDDDFMVGGGGGQAPGQIGLPEEDINCRCAIGWVFDEDEERGMLDADAIAKLQRFTEGV